MAAHTEPGPSPRRRREKRTRLKRILLIILAVILASAAAGAVFLKSKLDKIRYVPAPAPAEEEPAEEGEDPFAGEDPLVDISGLEQVEELTVPDGEVSSEEDVLNILLLGTDFPFDSSDPGRADAIMILSLDMRDSSARLVSLERGMGMPILSGKYKGQRDWLTHLYHYGGADMMIESIRYCFKVDLERYAQVDFAAFQGVIDVLGGIDMELSDAEAWKLGLPVGLNHLNGAQALSFARLRSIDSDWVRVTRQRRVIQACADGLKDADLLTLNALADAVLPMITTNFTQREMLSLLTKLPAFRGVQLQQMTIPAKGTYGGMTVMGGRGSFAPDFEKNAQILHQFLYNEK
jgi:LCP family protein required for cell wall assembly